MSNFANVNTNNLTPIKEQLQSIYSKLNLINNYLTDDSKNNVISKELVLQYTASYTMKSGNTKNGYLLSAPYGYYIYCFSSSNLDTSTPVYNEGSNYTGTDNQTPIYNIIKPVQCEGSYYKYDIDLLKTNKVFIESATTGTMDVWVVFKIY